MTDQERLQYRMDLLTAVMARTEGTTPEQAVKKFINAPNRTIEQKAEGDRLSAVASCFFNGDGDLRNPKQIGREISQKYKKPGYGDPFVQSSFDYLQTMVEIKKITPEKREEITKNIHTDRTNPDFVSNAAAYASRSNTQAKIKAALKNRPGGVAAMIGAAVGQILAAGPAAPIMLLVMIFVILMKMKKMGAEELKKMFGSEIKASQFEEQLKKGLLAIGKDNPKALAKGLIKAQTQATEDKMLDVFELQKQALKDGLTKPEEQKLADELANKALEENDPAKKQKIEGLSAEFKADAEYNKPSDIPSLGTSD